MSSRYLNNIYVYLEAGQRQFIHKIYTAKVFSEMNMTHMGWGLERKATQETVTNNFSYIRSKNIYSANTERNKKAIFGEFNHGFKCSFAVTSWVTLDFTLLRLLSLSYLSYICTARQKAGQRPIGESDRAVPEKALNLR